MIAFQIGEGIVDRGFQAAHRWVLGFGVVGHHSFGVAGDDCVNHLQGLLLRVSAKRLVESDITGRFAKGTQAGAHGRAFNVCGISHLDLLVEPLCIDPVAIHPMKDVLALTAAKHPVQWVAFGIPNRVAVVGVSQPARLARAHPAFASHACRLPH